MQQYKRSLEGELTRHLINENHQENLEYLSDLKKQWEEDISWNARRYELSNDFRPDYDIDDEGYIYFVDDNLDSDEDLDDEWRTIEDIERVREEMREGAIFDSDYMYYDFED
jgi:hypothetical protein